MGLREIVEQYLTRFGLHQVYSWLANGIRRILDLSIKKQPSDLQYCPAEKIVNTVTVVVNVDKNLLDNRGLDDLRQDLESRTTERRSGNDRRSGSVEDRMRCGLGKSYYLATGAGETDPITYKVFLPTFRNRRIVEDSSDVVKILLPEAKRFKYYDSKGREVDAEVVITSVISEVWVGERIVVRATKELVLKILARYKVIPIDRRKADYRLGNCAHSYRRAA
jgi:hypothetical protein